MPSFLDEVSEQSLALKQTLQYYLDPLQGGKLLREAAETAKKSQYTQIVYTGMGSSFFNSHIPLYYLNAKGIPTYVQDSGEMIYFNPPRAPSLSKGLFIGVSQSGESGELVKFLTKWDNIWKMSIDLWAITNTSNSTLANKAAKTFLTFGGIETSVTSKTYVTGLMVQYLLSRAIAGEEICPKSLETEYLELIEAVSKGIHANDGGFYSMAKSINDFLGNFSFLNFIGQGTSMATVLQATLNLKEISKVYAEGLTVGMFRHGPIEIITPDYRAVVIVNDKIAAETANPVIKNITNKWGHGKVVLISNQPEIHQEIRNENLLLIENPIQNPYLAPIFEIMLLQPYLCLKATQNGFVPGEFRNSQKITK